MTLKEYQDRAMTTCMDSCNNFSYMFLNLVGEIGEFASKVAKAIRKNEMGVDDNCLYFKLRNESFDWEEKLAAAEEELKKEAGDILWQLSGLCSVMGWSLEDIAQQNLDKLASRQRRNVIDGNGDNR